MEGQQPFVCWQKICCVCNIAYANGRQIYWDHLSWISFHHSRVCSFSNVSNSYSFEKSHPLLTSSFNGSTFFLLIHQKLAICKHPFDLTSQSWKAEQILNLIIIEHACSCYPYYMTMVTISDILQLTSLLFFQLIPILWYTWKQVTSAVQYHWQILDAIVSYGLLRDS